MLNRTFQNISHRTQQNSATSGLKEGFFQEELAELVSPTILDYDVIMYSNVLRDQKSYQNFFGRIQIVETNSDITVKKLYNE